MDNKKFYQILRETMPVNEAVLFLIKKEYGSVYALKKKIGVSHQGVYGALKGQFPEVRRKISEEIGFDPWL